MADLAWLSAHELLAGYRTRAFQPSEALSAVIAQIERENPRLNAFTTLSLDVAVEDARRADAAWSEPGSARPLEGVPVAVKDLFDTASLRTTYGSSIFADHMPLIDADVVARVKAAGGIIIGKTATHEFGWGITTNSAYFGPTRNPWAPDRSPGGSSGGSAVALATGMAPLAIGSDTGGSIRIPAAFCGVVGLKPTWGRISASGAIALAPSLDHPGAMARDPSDAKLLYEVLAAETPVPRVASDPLEISAAKEFGGLRVGIASPLENAPLSTDVDRVFAGACARLSDLGANLVEINLPDPASTLETFVAIQRAEALNYHRSRSLYPDEAAQYGSDVRGRLEAAANVTLADYIAAQLRRQTLRMNWVRLLATIDVVLSPVSAISPPPVGQERVEHFGRDRDVRDLVMPYTVPQDLVGVPACAVRAGFDDEGTPVGVQLTAAWCAEESLLRWASAFAAAMPESPPWARVLAPDGS